MQCCRVIWRNACKAQHAYNPALALRATFSSLHDQSPKTGISQKHKHRHDDSNQDPYINEARKLRSAHNNLVDDSLPKNNGTQNDPQEDSLQDALQEDVPQGLDTPDWIRQMRSFRAKSRKRLEKRQTIEEAKALKLEFEYQGIAIEPSPSSSNKRLPFPWALDPPKDNPGSSRDALQQEIRQFTKYMTLTPAERVARTTVTSKIYHMIRNGSLHSNIQVSLFGSETSGLALSTSDLDFKVHGVRSNHAFTLDSMDSICALLLQPNSGFGSVKYRGGKFPIISAQHLESHVKVNLVVTTDRRVQQASTLALLQQHPNLTPLYYLLRIALKSRGLGETFNGGIGSYSTLILILWTISRPATRNLAMSDQLLQLLSDISTFDPVKHGLTFLPRAKKFLRHQRTPQVHLRALESACRRRLDLVRNQQYLWARSYRVHPYLPAIQDPADYSNNLGINVFAVKHVIETCRAMGKALRENLKAWDEGKWFHSSHISDETSSRSSSGSQPTSSGDSSTEPLSLLTPLLGRYHESEEALGRRRLLQFYGEKVMARNRHLHRDYPEGPFGEEVDLRRKITEGNESKKGMISERKKRDDDMALKISREGEGKGNKGFRIRRVLFSGRGEDDDIATGAKGSR